MHIGQMPEPLRTLFLQALKTAGNLEDAALGSVEESMTFTEYADARDFLAWLRKNNLTVGHGTIDLRYVEYTHGLVPMSKEEAYEWAMKRASA